MKSKKSKSILWKAYNIVDLRGEERDRAYGGFSDGMKRMAKIASIMCGKELSSQDMFYCMIALKLSRQSFNHKEDNLTDLCAYVGAFNNYMLDKKKQAKLKSKK